MMYKNRLPTLLSISFLCLLISWILVMCKANERVTIELKDVESKKIYSRSINQCLS